MPDLVSQPFRGESHHWADDQRVVVDLGETKGAGAAAAAFDPSIVILTHSDEDHIGGGAEFFNQLTRGTRREMWVPHDWSLLLSAQRGLTHSDTRVLDDASTVLSGQMHTFLGRMIGERYLGDLYEDLRKKSEKLRALISAAEKQNVRVRYFSVDHPDPTWQTQGRPGVATLVNASEKAPARDARRGSVTVETVLFLYALTIQNKRALVTYLWNSNYYAAPDGALIWSDTDGSHCGDGGPEWIPWKHLGVMTAPHHGSAEDVHQDIWKWHEEYRNDLAVVLAGGRSGQGVAPEFLGVPGTERGCTMCGLTRAKGLGYNEVGAGTSSPSPNCHENGCR